MSDGSRRRELLPVALRQAVGDAAGGHVLNDIHTFYGSEGFRLPADFELPPTAMRRTTAAAYEGAINISSADDVERYLRVVERVLDELGDNDTQWAATQTKRIHRELGRAGITIEAEGRLVAASSVRFGSGLATAPDWSGVHLSIRRLEQSKAEPEERVGAAKELVEATIKLALDELGESYQRDDDVPSLAKNLHRRLKLDPAGVAPTERGATTIIRILGGLTQVPQGLAELRNAGYGTGHGQAKRISGIKPRHAELAVRVAAAYSGFVMDTLTDPEAPWRK